MGVAGISLLMAGLFFYRSIEALVTFLIWRKHELLIGTIGECIQKTPIKNGTIYSYDFLINAKTKLLKTKYEETVKNDKSPSRKKGDQIEVFYNPEIYVYKEKAKMIKDLWENPLLFLLGIGLFVLCLFIVAKLSS